MNLNNKRRLTVDQTNSSPPKKQKFGLYLVDYTPIRTIELTNFAENVTAEYLRGYFEHASGPVANVSFVHKLEENQTIRIAYVTFVLPEDAARLICDPNLNFNVKFTIKEAESALQPKIDPNVLKFEEINDDCLLHIASYLDLIDVVNLGRSCTRLQRVVKEIYRKKTHFSFGTNTGDSSINEVNLPTILEDMGSYIRSIEWHHLQLQHLSYLWRHCKAVTGIKLIHPSRDLNVQSIKEFKSFFRCMKRLAIHDANFFDVTFKAILSSNTRSRLKMFELNDCVNVRGKFLSTCRLPKLKCLKITDSPKMGCLEVFGFVRNNNNLTTISFDSGCSFRQCFILPSECLSKLTEIELDFSFFTDAYLKDVNFAAINQVKTLIIRQKYAATHRNFNSLLLAMQQSQQLNSLVIERAILDVDTVTHLGAFANLQRIHFKNVNNTIGRQLYSRLHLHLPQVTYLTIEMQNMAEATEFKAIAEMTSALEHLKHFSHSSIGISWELLDMILQLRLTRKQAPLEVGICAALLCDPRKKDFDAKSKGAVILSLKK